jgi:hypothetical protein
MAKYAQGFYEIKNPNKYIGRGKPKYRSSWELVFCQFCDLNENVIQWASESIQIPYRNPLTGKQTIYVPDFFIIYNNKQGTRIAELVEIKPKKQTILEEKVTNMRDRLAIAVNYAKWEAASIWAKKNGIMFRVINEDMIFYSGRR